MNNLEIINLIILRIQKLRKNKNSVTLAIDGPAGIGKTTFSRHLSTYLHEVQINSSVLELDGNLLPRDQREELNIDGYDYRAMNFHKLHSDLDNFIKFRKDILVGKYNHTNGTISSPCHKIPCNEVVILEGIHSLHDDVYDLAKIDIGIFIQAPDEVMKALRHKIDINERGYSELQFQELWERFNFNYYKFVFPERKNANLILESDIFNAYRVIYDNMPTLSNRK